jgi:hypothetical protein
VTPLADAEIDQALAEAGVRVPRGLHAGTRQAVRALQELAEKLKDTA